MKQKQAGKKDGDILKLPAITGRTKYAERENLHDPQALIGAIRQGDSEAFEALYMGYGDSIVKFLAKMLGNLEDAKEITQDTFALLWEKRETLNPHTSLKGFVGGIAKNLALQHIRSRKARFVADNDLYYSGLNDIAALADEQMISREIELLVKHSLSKMPPQRRRVFEMSREQGLSYKEIAERLNISSSTVRTHIELAREELRGILSAFLVYLLFV